MTPRLPARIDIDNLLEQAGWSLQDAGEVDLYARNGVAARDFPLKSDRGAADYLNGIDPEPRSRPVFSFHAPETLDGKPPGNSPKPSRSSRED